MPDYRRRATREAMSVRVDLSGLVAAREERGHMRRAEVERVVGRLASVAAALRKRKEHGEVPFLALAERRELLSQVKALAEEVRRECDTLVVVGAGGTAHATRALLGAVEQPSPRLAFLETLDPHALAAWLETVDLARTTFNVVSKSGETPETLAQFLLLRDLLLRHLGGVDYISRIIVTTDADQGALRQIVHDEGFRSLPIPAGVAERFSVLSPTSLFPAAVVGMKVDEVLAGAAWMTQRCLGEASHSPAALLAAAAFVLQSTEGYTGILCLPFSRRLERFAQWASELWAEGLRRDEGWSGTPVQVPWLPVASVAWDFAWASQLVASGPGGVLPVLLAVEDHGREVSLAEAYADLEGVGYLGGKSLGQLIAEVQQAFASVLARRGRAFVSLRLPQVNAFTLGQLVALWQITVVFLAELYGVDPFQQPAADEYRRLLFGELGRKGAEAAPQEGGAAGSEPEPWVV